MITYTGESVWPKGSEHGDEGCPSLTSIAVGLSRMPRFAGQTKLVYTVLQHTFTVADLVAPEHRIFALLHDAPEAIVGDVPTTWKTQAARDCEDDLLERITRSLGLEWPWPERVIANVKEADELALAAEARVLEHAEADKWWPYVDREAEILTRRYLFDVRWASPDFAAHEYGFAVEKARAEWIAFNE